MSRLATSVAALVAVLGTPAFAADWSGDWTQEDFRGAYTNEPKDWAGLGDTDDTLTFETGLRYWYSWGAQNFDLDGSSVQSNDNAHIAELHLRIGDSASSTYVKGIAGYSAAINGSYEVPLSSGDISDGHVAYAMADFGWNAFNDGHGNGVGGFIGYHYWEDSPRTERDDYAIINSESDVNYNDGTGVWSVGADGVEHSVIVNALRLGISGQARLNDMIDVSGEIAAIPYASVSGLLGGRGDDQSFGPNPGCDNPAPAACDPYFFITSPLKIEGMGYGAEAEGFIGFHPTENLTFRLGARAWYLTGSYDATYSGATVTPPQRQPNIDDPNSNDPNVTIPPSPLYGAPGVASDDFIDTNNPFSMFRYGILAELTYNF